jgi:hypothetical protein
MSELLNSLNQPSGEQPKSFAQEVAEASEAYKPEPTPEPEHSEPVAEAEAAPEEAPAPVQQAPAPQDDDRKVSLKALQEERQKRQEIERRLAEMENWLAQGQQQQPQQQFEEPDPETDPIGALKYTRQQLEQIRQAEQSRSQEGYFKNVYQQDAQRFASQTPDFGPAYQYVIQSRAQELEAIGTPPDVISQIVQAEEMQLVSTAMRNRVSPAEAIYKFAKARGFTGAQPAAPAPAPAPAPSPELQKARQAVSVTPTATGNKPAPSAMTLETLAGLKGAAFDKAFEKHFYGNREGSMFRR